MIWATKIYSEVSSGAMPPAGSGESAWTPEREEQVLYDCLVAMRADGAALRTMAQTWFIDREHWDLI